MIKNIVFDIGNVLIDFHWRETMKELGIPESVIPILGTNMVENKLWGEMDKNIIPEEELVKRFKELSPDYVEYIDLFLNNMENVVTDFPRSEEWVKGLKEQGYKIYLLSNYPKRMFEMHMKNYSFMPYVDGMVVSYECNLVKPDDRIYNKLCEKYNIKPEESVFLDDRLENVEAARNLGFNVVHVINQDQAIDELKNIIIDVLI